MIKPVSSGGIITFPATNLPGRQEYHHPQHTTSTRGKTIVDPNPQPIYSQHMSDVGKGSQMQKILVPDNLNLPTEPLDMASELKILKDQNAKLEEGLKELKGFSPYALQRYTHRNDNASDLVIGSFNTKEVRPGSPSWTTASKNVEFSMPCPTRPVVIVGLSKLDISGATNLRITSYLSNILNNKFTVNIDGANGTELHQQNTCSWLEIDAANPDIQGGRFNTHEYAPWTKPVKLNNRQITFQRPYDSPPRVVVWLSGFDIASQKNYALGAHADDISLTGFTIHLQTWKGCDLHSAIVSWISYPTGMAGILSGMFDTIAMRPVASPQPYNSGYISFPTGHFSSIPRVVVAISALDIDKKSCLRLHAYTSSVSASGMAWHLNAWDDTVLYFARADYIAIA